MTRATRRLIDLTEEIEVEAQFHGSPFTLNVPLIEKANSPRKSDWKVAVNEVRGTRASNPLGDRLHTSRGASASRSAPELPWDSTAILTRPI